MATKWKDLKQVKAMRDRGEDETSPHAPEAESLGADFWKSARVVMPAERKRYEDE